VCPINCIIAHPHDATALVLRDATSAPRPLRAFFHLLTGN
jgi:hypothetical protein